MRSGRRRVCFVGSPNAILLLEPYKIPPSKEAQNRRQVALGPHRSCSSASIKGLRRRRNAFARRMRDAQQEGASRKQSGCWMIFSVVGDRQDQSERLMFEPPAGLDVTKNWAGEFNPRI